jgi:hypothetical protein
VTSTTGQASHARAQAPGGGQRCPGCGEEGQAAPCAFCGQPQDPACGHGVTYDPPGDGTPGRWRCSECGAITADDPPPAAT